MRCTVSLGPCIQGVKKEAESKIQESHRKFDRNGKKFFIDPILFYSINLILN
ncbi:MAG: hypothetical protein ACR5K9_01710 [Wolbachia sp.]